MATGRIDLAPMAPFDPLSDPSSLSQRWKTWKRRFETYLVALNVTATKQKRALLLYQAGQTTQDIFDTLAETGEDDDYDSAVAALDLYFSPQKHVDYEVFKFRDAKQQPHETIDQFATRLRKLAATCDFASVDKEVKSAIIQNCLSKRLRRYALLDNEVTLTKLLAKGRAFELSESQATGIEQSFGSASISDEVAEAVSPVTKNNNNSYNRDQQHTSFPRQDSSTQPQCRNCGGPWPHNNNICPAKGKSCLNCGKVNHFAKVCRSAPSRSKVRFSRKPAKQYPKVRKISGQPASSESSSEDEFIFTLNKQTLKDKTTPQVQIAVNNTSIKMVIDTGASIDIIDEVAFNTMRKHTPIALQRSTTRIFAYGATKQLPVMGKFNATLDCSTGSTTSEINVIEGNFGCLLSYKTASALGLIMLQVNNVKPKHSNHEQLLNEYANLFEGIGTLKNFEVKLHIDESVPPVAQPPRRIPFHMRQKVSDALDKLERDGIIEKISDATPWVSPLVVIPKKDGDIRLCVDMRMANQAIQRERHPTPTVDDLIHKLNGATVFTKLDLRSGYHQLSLAEESRHITTFATHKGLRRYKKLNFGTNSASEIFQQVISEQIRDIPNAINISDDIIIFGKTQADHDEALRAVFQRFSLIGLTLNWDKCEFSQSQLTFFGFVFSGDGISPDPTKVDAIRNCPPPRSVKDVRSFLGMATYCAKFIPNFSDLSEPLRELTRKNVSFSWTSRHAQSFDAVKAALTSETVMAYFDKTKETELITDASPSGLSAILTQKVPGSDERHVVAYVSRALSDVERRYSQTEREALAIVWAIERLHIYLYGGHFKLITDCKPVELILTNPKSRPPARIERWNLRLQDYDFEVSYTKGIDNPSDFLSRHLPVNDHTEDKHFQTIADNYVCFLTHHAIPKAMTLPEIQQATMVDPTLKFLKNLITTGKWHLIDSIDIQSNPNINLANLKAFQKIKTELTLNEHDGIILRGSRIVLPECLRLKAIRIAHEGHQGLVKTKKLLREKVWYPGIDKLAKHTVDTCILCQANGPNSHPEPFRMTTLPPEPWHTVNIDFCGPFPGGAYLLVVIDAYSRFPEVEIVSSTSAKSTILKLERIFATHGIPQVLKSDNGPPFPSHEFQQFLKELGIKHKPSSPLWPQGNGEAENFMKPLGKAVRSAHHENKDWKREIFKFLLNYRATPHATTGKSPAELLYNRPIRTKLPQVTVESKSPLHQEVKERDAMSKKTMKGYADTKTRAKVSDIKKGDIVLVRQPKSNKMSTKHDPAPYQVLHRRGNRVTAIRHGKYITRNISFFKKLSHLKEYGSSQLKDLADEDCHSSDSEVGDEAEQNDPDPRYPVRERHRVPRYGNNIYD